MVFTQISLCWVMSLTKRRRIFLQARLQQAHHLAVSRALDMDLHFDMRLFRVGPGDR